MAGKQIRRSIDETYALGSEETVSHGKEKAVAQGAPHRCHQKSSQVGRVPHQKRFAFSAVIHCSQSIGHEARLGLHDQYSDYDENHMEGVPPILSGRVLRRNAQTLRSQD